MARRCGPSEAAPAVAGGAGTASNGNDAPGILAGGAKIDLLVLDVVMPGLSGLQTIEELRKQGHTELPVVLLTAQAKDEDILRGYKKGADCYITTYKADVVKRTQR